MKKHPSQKNSRFAYSHNQSVLIQFLLREFLDCYRQMQNIHLILKKTKIDTSALKAIGEILSQMLGPLRQEGDFFTWIQGSGTIRLFAHYCQVLCEYEKRVQKDSMELLAKVTLSMHDYLLSQEILRQGEKLLSTNNQQLTQFLRYLERAESSFTRASEIIPDILFRCKKDENILFFLLRHGEEMDTLFSPGFVRELLMRCYPKGGIKKAESYIIGRYEARGFSLLPQQISHYIGQLS